MKILFVVTYLYPRGGDSNHAFSVVEGLRERGHEVLLFGMQDEKNVVDLPGPFAPRVDFREIHQKKTPRGLFKALRSIYSLPAKKAAAEFIDLHGPFDIAHVHSVHHQLTMSVLDALKVKHIPFVWTLHDYKLICPNTTLFNETIGKRCENPGEGSPLCIVRRRCKKGSFLASVLAGTESAFNYLGGYYNYPQCFILPSSFLKELIVSRNVTDCPLRVIPNFSPLKPEMKPESSGSDFLFIGRLSRGKGIALLIRAFADSYHRISGKLVIVGSGDADNELRILASELLPEDRYVFAGQIDSSEEIAQYYRNARCMILPSVWYENLPLSILEAFSFARPVIASNIGGIPEMVLNGETGILFEPGSVDGLTDALILLNNDTEAAKQMGINGWNMVKTEFSKNAYISKLLKLYSDVLQGSE